jgi:hypothetical protein
MTASPEAQIYALAHRVETNTPRPGDPEKFHVEKSEIASDLRKHAKDITENCAPRQITL